MDFTTSNNSVKQILQIQENPHPQQKQKCEIKEESIKCEGLENQQTQPTKESQPNPTQNNEEVQVVELRWFKCEKCLFLGISQQSLDNHSCIENERTKHDCPGCSNSFFSTVSLESHLLEDHKMLKEEIETFLNQLSESSRSKKKKSKPTDKNKEKSRIYIKNVQLLKKPQESPSAGKSKIYIKNVQLLRKPTLSQTFPDNLLDGFEGLEDDDLTHFNLFNTTAPENFGTETTENQTSNEFQPQIYVRSMETMNNSQENQEYFDTNSVYQTEPLETNNYQQESDRSRSKISIKNISVLKEPNLIHPNIFNSENNNQNFPSIHLKSVDELNSTFATTNNNSSNSQQMTTTMTSSSSLTTQFLDFSMESHYHNIDYSFIPQTDDNDDTETIILDNIEIENPQQLPYSGNQQESLNDLMNFNMPTISSSNYVLKGPEFADEDFLMIPLDNDTNNSQPVPEITPICNIVEAQGNSTITAMETVDVSENEISDDHRWNQQEETSESIEHVPVTEPCIENASNPEKIPTIEIQDDDHPKSEQIVETPTPTVNLENAETNQPRIYVASNLMKDSSQQKKGRPKGAKKIIGGSGGEIEKQFRCGFEKCGCRFATIDLMQYHRQCHTKDNEHGIICPECKGNEWKNWNSLHSHLFRVHSIDMGLYKCDKCNFRTPNLSLLNNMHSKIHQDDKNFNCTQCQKAFKNSKQLKNHRRTHRLKEAKQALLEKSEDGLKVVTENGSLICVKCHKKFPNEITLQAHAEIHMKKGDNYECSKCSFVTTDHNSFRRHNLKHADYHPYKCQFCSYTCVQSAPYRKHIEKRHPEEIQNVFFKCMKCKFTTINRTKFEFHQQKHDERPSIETISKPIEVMEVLNEVLPPVTTIQDSTINVIDITDSNEVLIIDDNDKVIFPDVNLINIPNQNKIKVKSNLVLTDPNKYVNLSCSGFLHDILPNQISASSSNSYAGTVPNHQPMIRPAMFAKMDNTIVHDQNQQNLEQQDFHPYGSTIDSSWIMNN